MGTTERVIQYIDFKGISKYKFCKNLGLSNKFLDNSSNMGTDKACKILRYYPEINAEWLLTGEGSMIKTEIQSNYLNEESNAYNINYKDLAESRKETIDCLRKEIAYLEEKIASQNNKRKAG